MYRGHGDGSALHTLAQSPDIPIETTFFFVYSIVLKKTFGG